MPGGAVVSAERIIAFYTIAGTLPRVTAAPSGEEEQLYRALTRMRILHRQEKFNHEAAAVLDAGCPGWANGRAFGRDRLCRLAGMSWWVGWRRTGARRTHPQAMQPKDLWPAWWPRTASMPDMGGILTGSRSWTASSPGGR